MIVKRALTPRQFVTLLNMARSAYLDEGGRGNSSFVYKRLVDIADVLRLKQDGNGWWKVPQGVDPDIQIVVGVERTE